MIDPNPNSKPDPLLKRRSDAQINGIVNEVAKSILRETPPSDSQTQCMFRAKDVTIEVVKQLRAWYLVMPLRPSKEQAFNKLKELYLAGFAGWSANDIRYVNALAHATIIIETLSNELA